ncbi:MAG: two-component regulator propeller domain-containing protein [Aestuariibaculum sp.]
MFFTNTLFSRKTTFFLFSFFIFIKGIAQDYPVKYIDISQGLSNNSVTTIYQDTDGYIWFGTYDGLNRYDGYEFKIFKNIIDNPSSIPANYIRCLDGDSKNNLWIGTSNGACIYKKENGAFLPLSFSNKTEKHIPFKDIVMQIKCISLNTTLIGGQKKGLVMFNNNSLNGEQIPFEISGKTKTEYSVSAIETLNDSICLIGINKVGLCELNINNKQLTLKNSILKQINCLKKDKDSIVIVGTNEGLFKYSTKTNTLSKNILTNKAIVTNIIKDKKGSIWIATDGFGVFTIKGHIASPFYNNATDKLLKSQAVWGLYEDREGNKWFGTIRGGISMLSNTAPFFEHIKYTKDHSNNTADNFILSFFEDNSKNIWIGTDGAGIRQWNRKNNNYTHYKAASGKNNALSSNFITKILQDNKGDFWVSTWGGGINKINTKSNTIKHYPCVNETNGRTEENVWILYHDSKQNIWAATADGGPLYRYDKQTDTFKTHITEVNDLLCLTETKDGKFWAGNYSKLFCIDPESKAVKPFDMGYAIRCILEGRDNTLWVGTSEGGLLLYNRITNTYKRFTEKDGLPSNTILNMLEDQNSNLWISTYNGLCRFNPYKNTFRNFSVSDGLQSNQFNSGAALGISSGEFLFGGINGFNMFHPEHIKDSIRPTKILLSNLLINNSPIENTPNYITESYLKNTKSTTTRNKVLFFTQQ